MDQRLSEGFPLPDLPASLTSDVASNVTSDALSGTFSLLSLSYHGNIEIRVPPSTATENDQDNNSRRQSIEERTSELSELSLSNSYTQIIPRAELASTPTAEIGENLVTRYEYPPLAPIEPPAVNTPGFATEPPRMHLLNFQLDDDQDMNLALAISKEEDSPEGSPGSKYEEFVPNSYFDPDIARFRERRYKRRVLFDCGTVTGRISTLFDWVNPYITREGLASAGFYYEGFGDKVYCYFCEKGLENWTEGDDPSEEHFRNFGKHCL